MGSDLSDGLALFLSIRPQFASAIVAGDKSVELRRIRPRAGPGVSVVIYASSPVMSVLAMAKIRGIETDVPRRMWTQVEHAAGISKREYDQYFLGARQAVAIELIDINVLDEPIPLSKLRETWPEFHPPQGFRYVRTSELDLNSTRGISYA